MLRRGARAGLATSNARRRTRVLATVLGAVALLTIADDRAFATRAVDVTHRAVPPVLLFAGNGTSPGDVEAVARILRNERLTYREVSSAELNHMTVSALATYRLLVVPGGNFIDMSASLSAAAVARVHDAVAGGLHYLGICAGAFVADDGHGHYRSFNLSPVQFRFYSAERAGVRKAALRITGADGRALEQYWEDGPELTGWGMTVAKYPDGTPAVVEGNVGRGFVVLTGVHPEAPDSWRRGLKFTMPARDANAYAGVLVRAALEGRELPHF